MIDSGYYPEMEIIDEVSESEWEYWEKFYIQYLKYIGCNLTNTTNKKTPEKILREFLFLLIHVCHFVNKRIQIYIHN